MTADRGRRRTPSVAGPVPWSTDMAIVAAAVISSLVAWLFMARLAGVELTVSTGVAVRDV